MKKLLEKVQWLGSVSLMFWLLSYGAEWMGLELANLAADRTDLFHIAAGCGLASYVLDALIEEKAGANTESCKSAE